MDYLKSLLTSPLASKFVCTFMKSSYGILQKTIQKGIVIKMIFCLRLVSLHYLWAGASIQIEMCQCVRGGGMCKLAERLEWLKLSQQGSTHCTFYDFILFDRFNIGFPSGMGG